MSTIHAEQSSRGVSVIMILYAYFFESSIFLSV